MAGNRPKIYFAGSIRGGREDAALYGELIRFLTGRGKVLTEHVGAANVGELEKNQTDSDIYEQDVAWIRESDLVIAECTRPSLGVGYELAYAEALGKPCFLLYRGEEGSLSAMLAGNPYFRIFRYGNAEDAKRVLDGILSGYGC